ncbi:uncharacterized protein BJ171DRAFT_496608 [Polychytrium aggregatum]|uniref:uncharacterized protein n=1 Tax=Polychytrium aggregatum TaxID=110093 RepID=UPI0022FDDC72|nr:uncharacterized protein BJ171DRAFT_496608 [Polychytrium aggregatum]KAI9206695.1 hypothetical protein BJ171DRAFT_496608 [Polychytrium aggregatum]
MATELHPATRALLEFLQTPLDELIAPTTSSNGSKDPPEAQRRLLATFATLVAHVPAYKTFLQASRVDHATVSSFEDLLQSAPYVDKFNYINQYQLADRSFDGNISTHDFLHCSSGSGGSPTFWGRFSNDELDICIRMEQFMHDSFRAHLVKSLVVICFPLGSWVGGLFTILTMRNLSMKNYKITLVTPGTNVADILRIVQTMSPSFEQTIVVGYPPFVKTVIDAGILAHVHWEQKNIKLVFAGEVFSEEWRDLVRTRAGIKCPETDIVSMYGTADAGVLATETPLSIHIRRLLSRTLEAGDDGHGKPQTEIVHKIFGKERLPTLCQYDPCVRWFELTPKQTLALSTIGRSSAAWPTAPLLRYDIGDDGGCLSYEDMVKTVQDLVGQDPVAHLQTALGDRAPPIRKLPFVWVFGRKMWVVSYFGANVYVENIMVGLEQPEVASFVTGKFVLQVAEDEESMDSFLQVIVELAPDIPPMTDLAATLSKSIHTHLCRLNSEFCNYVPKERQTISVVLHNHGDPKWFPVGVKHKYTL